VGVSQQLAEPFRLKENQPCDTDYADIISSLLETASTTKIQLLTRRETVLNGFTPSGPRQKERLNNDYQVIKPYSHSKPLSLVTASLL
jgi:hypothetical protein